MIASFIWNPSRFIFTIPGINYSLTWYGVLFACGFLVGYFIALSHLTKDFVSKGIPLVQARKEAGVYTDRLVLFVGLGTIIGARLGHVLFYEWSDFYAHPMEIFKIWKGGLSSHGAVIGILVALFTYIKTLPKDKKHPMGIIFLLDLIVTPTALCGMLIRIGNFINQEVVGIPTFKPWGVIFMDPVSGIPGIPLHPVQLYEGATYGLIALVLRSLWKRFPLGKGVLAGCFFITVFGARFYLEYFKLPQSHLLEGTTMLHMGQILSIPCILLGCCLLIIAYARKPCCSE